MKSPPTFATYATWSAPDSTAARTTSERRCAAAPTAASGSVAQTPAPITVASTYGIPCSNHSSSADFA